MSDRIHLATRKGVFTIQRSPIGTWAVTQASMLGDRFSIVMSDPRDGALYAAADLGHFGAKVYRSEDHGETWTLIGAPAYPPKPEGAPDVMDPMRKVPIPWNLELIWSLAAGGADQPDELWCGTVPGGLFRSTDRGATWSLNEPLWNNPKRGEWFGGGLDWPGIHSICVDPRNSDHLALGISCGGVWQSDDRGTTWACRADGMRAAYLPPEAENNPNQQDPHCLVQCRAEPDAMWVQHHNGIFRSTDRSASWREIENVQPSTFGFAVAVHPRDGDTAWFVPAVKDETRIPSGGRLVVTRTRDGGQSFDQLTQGLPQEHAYDLVYRHSLDVDATGDRLAFGSTTGSLFISENQGDTWTCISTHLPPIYCVRFDCA